MLYIFDLDGTLRITKSGKPAPNDRLDQELLHKVRDKIRLLKQDHQIAILSNQGGVSCGYMTEQTAWQIALDFVKNYLGLRKCEIRLCFYHPAGKYRHRYVDRGKPKPDMIFDLLEETCTQTTQAVMVGNEYTDSIAARDAGILFHWAHEFFGWSNDFVRHTDRGYFPREWYWKWLEVKHAKGTNCTGQENNTRLHAIT